jgi:hypothetical protein
MPDRREPFISPDCLSFWNDQDQDVTIDLYDDGTIGVKTTGANYRDRDNYDTRDGVDVRYSKEQSVEFVAALQAWIEQLDKPTKTE